MKLYLNIIIKSTLRYPVTSHLYTFWTLKFDNILHNILIKRGVSIRGASLDGYIAEDVTYNIFNYKL